MSCGIGGSRSIRSTVRIKTIASHGAGEMAEWLKAHAWKACLLERVTWVRIPLSPPYFLLSLQTPGCEPRGQQGNKVPRPGTSEQQRTIINYTQITARDWTAGDRKM